MSRTFTQDNDRYFNADKAAFFDAQADAPWAASGYSQDEKKTIGRTLGLLPPLKGCRVLEPGCGVGRLTEILAEKVGSQGFVVAMDISAKMIQGARARLEGWANVRILCASLESMVLPEASLDLIFCHQVFPHFDCKETALDIMSRALKPGGSFVILHLMGIRQINDLHRKAGTAVAGDLMPSNAEMGKLPGKFGLDVKKFEDGDDHYLIVAQKRTPTTESTKGKCLP